MLKRVTQRDVARELGLSHATVSLALGGRGASLPAQTRERVLAKALEMGYRPNAAAVALVRGSESGSGLAPGSRLGIGVWMPFGPELAELVAGSRERGLAVVILDGGPSEVQAEVGWDAGALWVAVSCVRKAVGSVAEVWQRLGE